MESSTVQPHTPAAWPGLRALAAEGGLPVTVQGECMSPGIPPGTVVQVRPRAFYWPGDILAFRRRDGRLLLHRLIGWRPWQGRLCLVTLADAARAGGRPDAPLAPADVLGRALVPVSTGQRLRALAAFLRLAAAKLLAR